MEPASDPSSSPVPGNAASGSAISVHVFAERLTELLRGQPDPDTGKPYSSERMAALLTERGVRMSGTHMWHLRTGRAVPRLTEVVGFAEFFGVGLDFFDPAISPDLLAQWRLAGEFRSHRVEEVALRQLTDQFPEQDRPHVTEAILGVLHGFKALRAAGADATGAAPAEGSSPDADDDAGPDARPVRERGSGRRAASKRRKKP